MSGPLDPADATPFDSKEFVLQAGEAMSLARAPIVYLHPFEGSAPTMVLVDAEEWSKILKMIPETEESTYYFTANHNHIEPEELEEEPKEEG